MLSVFDQENLTSTHATNAANKPLNQGVRALQPKTPGPVAKTPFLTRNNENNLLATGKGGKNAFVTPAPRTNRAPLGAKTTNAKVQPFQTPAAKPLGNERNAQKSTTRRTTKKKIYVEPEPVVEPEVAPEESDEPDFGFAPPDPIPLPDPPLDFSEIDQTYPELQYKNLCKELRQHYWQSPKDENGFSISLKKQEQEAKLSLEGDLAHISEEHSVSKPEEDQDDTVPQDPSKIVSARVPQAARVDTIRARSAVSNLSQTSKARTHQRLPSVVTRETAASKQKRKSSTIAATEARSVRAPVYTPTIGFPKARKPASILHMAGQDAAPRPITHKKASSQSVAESDNHTVPDNAIISPRKFVQLYGTPDVETDMWCKLKELEIKDRRREDEGSKASAEDNIFDFEVDSDLDAQLAAQSGIADDFELSLEDL